MLGVPGPRTVPAQAGSLEAWLEADVLLAVGAVAVLVLLGGGYALLGYRNRPKAVAFRRRLAAVEEVAVLMHPRPDPDAMACAVAVKHVAENAGTRATVQYPGEIRHPENRAFRTVLYLDLEQIRHAREVAADSVILVDHNQPRGFEGAGGVSPYAVVDHHPGGGEGEVFTDVRTDYGACASILVEYFEDLGATRAGREEANGTGDLTLPAAVATGLTYGILSDTKNLTRGCTSADFAAMDYLYPGVDEDLLDRIANPQVDAEVLEVQSRAIAERDQRSPYAVSDVGEVGNLDAIPQAADVLLHLEGVTVVVVVGEKDGKLHFSGRSRDDRLHLGRALETAVDDIPMAGAGGHARMGGGQVPLAHMEGLRPDSGRSREEFIELLFDAIAGEA
jgi:nanoRNase/pAp phosphatase (c-di-AMP/oligoRNAs hydrolase)